MKVQAALLGPAEHSTKIPSQLLANWHGMFVIKRPAEQQPDGCFASGTPRGLSENGTDGWYRSGPKSSEPTRPSKNSSAFILFSWTTLKATRSGSAIEHKIYWTKKLLTAFGIWSEGRSGSSCDLQENATWFFHSATENIP